MTARDRTEQAKPPEELAVSLSGPFSWPGTPDAPSVFEVEAGRLPGIYLWTVPRPEGHLVYYVGETGRRFDVRLLEHYMEHAACMYHIYSPAEFARGEKIALWPGRYDAKDPKSVVECIARYSKATSHVAALTHLYRFMLAPLACEGRIRRRIEAAIARALRAAPGLAGTFQDEGISYVHRTADETPLECVVTSPVPLIGLPDRIWA